MYVLFFCIHEPPPNSLSHMDSTTNIPRPGWAPASHLLYLKSGVTLPCRTEETRHKARHEADKQLIRVTDELLCCKGLTHSLLFLVPKLLYRSQSGRYLSLQKPCEKWHRMVHIASEGSFWVHFTSITLDKEVAFEPRWQRAATNPRLLGMDSEWGSLHCPMVFLKPFPQTCFLALSEWEHVFP